MRCRDAIAATSRGTSLMLADHLQTDRVTRVAALPCFQSDGDHRQHGVHVLFEESAPLRAACHDSCTFRHGGIWRPGGTRTSMPSRPVRCASIRPGDRLPSRAVFLTSHRHANCRRPGFGDAPPTSFMVLSAVAPPTYVAATGESRCPVSSTMLRPADMRSMVRTSRTVHPTGVGSTRAEAVGFPHRAGRCSRPLPGRRRRHDHHRAARQEGHPSSGSPDLGALHRQHGRSGQGPRP